jgi:DNA-directed RNA polymerase subunit L
MELKIVEKGKDRIKVEVRNETHTFLNLLREKAWESGCDQASYIIEHPYQSDPVIIVKAKNPIKVLTDAGTKVTDQVKEFSRHFSRLSR